MSTFRYGKVKNIAVLFLLASASGCFQQQFSSTIHDSVEIPTSEGRYYMFTLPATHYGRLSDLLGPGGIAHGLDAALGNDATSETVTETSKLALKNPSYRDYELGITSKIDYSTLPSLTVFEAASASLKIATYVRDEKHQTDTDIELINRFAECASKLTEIVKQFSFTCVPEGTTRLLAWLISTSYEDSPDFQDWLEHMSDKSAHNMLASLLISNSNCEDVPRTR